MGISGLLKQQMKPKKQTKRRKTKQDDKKLKAGVCLTEISLKINKSACRQCLHSISFGHRKGQRKVLTLRLITTNSYMGHIKMVPLVQFLHAWDICARTQALKALDF